MNSRNQDPISTVLENLFKAYLTDLLTWSIYRVFDYVINFGGCRTLYLKFSGNIWALKLLHFGQFLDQARVLSAQE